MLRRDRRIQVALWPALLLCGLAVVPFARGLRGQSTMAGWNPYKSLDDKAVLATEGADESLKRALYEEILGRTLGDFGPFPSSIYARLIHTEIDFQAGKQRGITETQVADALNRLGEELGGSIYTGTNALQVRLLRVSFFAELPHLLKSPTPPPPGKLVGPDLSPAGAAFIGFLLLNQKLANPAWFGDPDQQNKLWLAWKPPSPSRVVDTRRPPAGFQPVPEPSNVTALIQRISQGLRDENSPVTASFHEFLDHAGFER